MRTLKQRLNRMKVELAMAYDNIHRAGAEINDEIQKEAPDSCQSILEAEQSISAGIDGISLFLQEVRSGEYIENQSADNKMFGLNQEK